MIGGHIFERMTFVEDDGLVVRQQTRILPTERQIAEKERMVDDQNVGAVSRFASREVKALLVIRAFFAEAIPRIGLDQIPHRRHRLDRKIGAAAIGRRARPTADLHELIDRGIVRKQRCHALLGDAESPSAEIIAATLDECGPEIERQFSFEKRNILRDQLLLQRDRVRGDDNREVFSCGNRLHGWNQIRK